jgi:hypothetical protein
MKKIILSLVFGILTISNVLAQQTLECQIMREQIMKQVNGNDVCSSNWATCMRTATDVYQRNACDMQRAGCQLGGAVGQAMSKESLNEAIRQYKYQCER